MKNVTLVIISAVGFGLASPSQAAPSGSEGSGTVEAKKIAPGAMRRDNIAPTLPAHRVPKPSMRRVVPRDVAKFDPAKRFAEKTKTVTVEGTLLEIEDGTVRIEVAPPKNLKAPALEGQAAANSRRAVTHRYWLLEGQQWVRRFKKKVGATVKVEIRPDQRGRPFVVGLDTTR